MFCASCLGIVACIIVWFMLELAFVFCVGTLSCDFGLEGGSILCFGVVLFDVCLLLPVWVIYVFGLCV